MVKKYDINLGVQKVRSKAAMVISGITLGVTGLVMALAIPLAANAAVSNNYSLFGDASIVSGGNPGNAAQTESSATAPGYGGVDFGVPSGVTTLSTLNNLSTDYKFTQGSCGGGAPRFSVTVQTPSGPSAFFYIGAAPNYTGCPQNAWLNTGNLASPTNLVDATQLGGTFYEPYAALQASYGSYPVTDVALVTDGGWAVGGTQIALFDNTQVNDNSYTYEPAPTKDSCKKDGWKTMQDANGTSFKNQGDCVSYFATNGKNLASGH